MSDRDKRIRDAACANSVGNSSTVSRVGEVPSLPRSLRLRFPLGTAEETVNPYDFGGEIVPGTDPIDGDAEAGATGITNQSGRPEIPMTSRSIPMKSRPRARRKTKSHTASTGSANTIMAETRAMMPTTIAKTRYQVGSFAAVAAMEASRLHREAFL